MELVEADPATGRIAFRARVRLPKLRGCTSGTASSTSSRSCAAGRPAFADFTDLAFDELQAVVDALPEDPADYPDLRVGDQGIKRKRWYVEGYERFDDAGELVRCDPKGLEVRTRIHDSVEAAVAALGADVDLLAAELGRRGLATCAIGFNPLRSEYVIDPPLGEWERAHRIGSPEERTAHLHMVTYGPDLNLSADGLRRARRGPEAHPLQPVARAAVVLLAVPRRRAVGRALGAHPPAHGRPARRAGVPRPGRRRRSPPTRRSPSPRGCPPRSAGWSSRRSTRSATSPSTASCSACSPGWSSTTPCPAGAPPRTRRRTGTSRRWASPTTRCTRETGALLTAAERGAGRPPRRPGPAGRPAGALGPPRERRRRAMLAAHAAGARWPR